MKHLLKMKVLDFQLENSVHQKHCCCSLGELVVAQSFEVQETVLKQVASEYVVSWLESKFLLE